MNPVTNPYLIALRQNWSAWDLSAQRICANRPDPARCQKFQVIRQVRDKYGQPLSNCPRMFVVRHVQPVQHTYFYVHRASPEMGHTECVLSSNPHN